MNDLKLIENIEERFFSSAQFSAELPELMQVFERCPPQSELHARVAFLIGCYFEPIDYSKAREYYSIAYDFAVQNQVKRLLSDTLYWMGYDAFREGKLREVIHFVDLALKIAIEINHPYRISLCHFMLATIASMQGATEPSIAHLLSSLKIADENKIKKLQARIHSKLAEFALMTNDLKVAKNHAIRAVSLSPQQSLCEMQVRLATVELELKEYGGVTALICQVRAELPKENHSLWGVTHSLLGKVYEAQRQYPKAETEFRSALKLADYANAERVRSNVHVHLSQLYLKAKKPRSALTQALAALKDAEKDQDSFVLKEALRCVHDVYKELSRYKQAHEYLERYNALVAESDAALLKSRLEYHALKSDYEQEKAKADMQTQHAELLRIKLEYKERELSEQIRHLLSQAEAVRTFRNDLRALIRRSSPSDPIVKEFRKKLQDLPEDSTDWLKFEAQFREVHPEFRAKLKEKYPDLSNQELRLCQLLRSGLKSHEAARLMCITERGVETHRLRIRRKMGLKGKENLIDVLQAL